MSEKITATQAKPDALAEIGLEACRLLVGGRFQALASRFGYALAFDRQPAQAIEEELAACLSELGATRLAPKNGPSTRVGYFEPGFDLLAVVECSLAAEPTGRILCELVVTRADQELYVTLEQISAIA